MIATIFSVVSIVFAIAIIAVGATARIHMIHNRRVLEREFGEYMRCDTGKLKREVAETERKTDETLETMSKPRRISFNDLSGVH